MTFAEKLNKVKQERNLTQVQMCKLTGKAKGSISQYLSGKQVPTEATQQMIALSLGLPRNYFAEPDEVIKRLTVKDVAKFLHMNCNTVRKGLQQGVFPWGYAIQTSRNRWRYFINAKRFAEIERGDRNGFE